MPEAYNTSPETDYGLFEQLDDVDWEAAFAGAVADIAASAEEDPDLSDKILLQRLDNLYDTASEEGLEYKEIQNLAYESMGGGGGDCCGGESAADSHGSGAKAEEERKKRLLEATKKAQDERNKKNKKVAANISLLDILFGTE